MKYFANLQFSEYPFSTEQVQETESITNEQQPIEGLSKKYDLNPTLINTWKKEFLANSSDIFEKVQLIQALYAQISELKVRK